MVFYAVMRVRTCYLDLDLLLLVSVLCMALCCLLSSVCGTVLAIVSLTLLNAKRKLLEMGSIFFNDNMKTERYPTCLYHVPNTQGPSAK